MYKVQGRIVPNNMNDIFGERHMSYNTRNSSGFQTKNIKSFHYVLETMLHLGPKDMGSRSVDDKKFRKH